jgi:hypothetical protein
VSQVAGPRQRPSWGDKPYGLSVEGTGLRLDAHERANNREAMSELMILLEDAGDAVHAQMRGQEHPAVDQLDVSSTIGLGL